MPKVMVPLDLEPQDLNPKDHFSRVLEQALQSDGNVAAAAAIKTVESTTATANKPETTSEFAPNDFKSDDEFSAAMMQQLVQTDEGEVEEPQQQQQPQVEGQVSDEVYEQMLRQALQI